MLNEQQQNKLLEIAHESLEAVVKESDPPDLSTDDPDLQEVRGAFVTLKRDGDLRGCIGHIEGELPLIETIARMAQAAAMKDPRFPPVSEEELSDLSIEISVMSPLSEVENVEEIEVGRDGLVISRGANRGLLLPQVPVEQDWDRQEFLRHTCQKANLPPDGWKDEDTTIEKFSAQVFGEED